MWRGGGRAQRPRHGAIARVSPAQRLVAASGRAPESAAAIRFARARQSGAGGPGPRNWEYVAPLRGWPADESELQQSRRFFGHPCRSFGEFIIYR